MSRFTAVRKGRHAFVLALLASAAPAFAQDSDPPPTPTETPTDPAAATTTPPRQSARSYAPADFARFSPRNALDMLNNVPGFSIDAGDTERRGLGEATSNVLINGERFTGRSTDIFTELRRISAANVTRIDIADGSTLQYLRVERPGGEYHHPVGRAFPAISPIAPRSAPAERRPGC